MKRISTMLIILSCLLFVACSNSKIGGADGPTNIFVKGSFGEEYERRPVRMFNVDGDLYYDTGILGDLTPRCGTMDGDIKKTVKENEIPLKDGEANFEAEGYQHATSITKEVSVDGKWVIFKKYKNLPEKLSDYKYCFYIKGHLNNADIDSEFVVLTDNINVTFHDVVSPMLSSVKANEKNGNISYETIVSGDKWGLSLYADDVTKTGITIEFEQFGGNPRGELQTGAAYKLETATRDKWQAVKAKIDNPVWNSMAYGIRKNDITELKVNWEFLYGELPSGFYRLSKTVMDFKTAGSYDEKTYFVHFEIK
ncbi:MAG: hypothetical protein IJV86_04290 [Clostridia bacterium]|nr:hypothetical protein [Clostridia bacterium]